MGLIRERPLCTTRRWRSALRVRRVIAGTVAAAALLGFLAGRHLLPAEDAVEAYLEAHPAFLVDHAHLIELARPVAEERRDAETRLRRERVLSQAGVAQAESTPRLGSATSPILVVEFTDYACLPCKASAAHVEQIAASNPDAQFVFAFVPGADTVAELAARVAMAAWLLGPDEFAALHRALMAASMQELPTTVDAWLNGEGIVFSRRRALAASAEVRENLRRMRALADELGVRGVPSFLVQGKLLTGAVAAGRLQQAIDSARERPSH